MPFNIENPQTAFVQSLLHAIRSAGQHGTGTLPEPNILKSLVGEIQKAIGKYDRLQIEVHDDSMTCGGQAVANSEDVVNLKELLQERRIASINFPKKPPTGELWSFLTTLAGPPDLLTTRGGPGYALMAVGVKAIQIEEAEEEPGAWELSTQDFDKIPIGISESTPLLQELFKVTEQIQESFSGKGPYLTATSLIMAWRRATQLHRSSNGGQDLPVELFHQVLPKLESLLLFAVLTRLAGTPTGNAMGEGLNDAVLANSLAKSVIKGGDGVKSACINIVAHARSTQEARLNLLQAMGTELQRSGHPNFPGWKALYHHFQGSTPAVQSDLPAPISTSPTQQPESSGQPEHIPHSSAEIGKLIHQLSIALDRSERHQIVTRLSAAGPKAVPMLVAASREGPWYFLRNIIKILGQIGLPEGHEPASRLLRHSEERVRFEGIRAMGRMGDPNSIRVLAKICGLYGESSARSTFGLDGDYFSTKDQAKYRNYAIAALGNSHKPQAVPILKKLLEDPPFSGRYANEARNNAATALESHKSTEARMTLGELSKNGPRAARRAIETALASAKKPG